MTLAELRDKIEGKIKRGEWNPSMPVFLLIGTDPNAPAAIATWLVMSSPCPVSRSKIEGAEAVLHACVEWPVKEFPS